MRNGILVFVLAICLGLGACGGGGGGDDGGVDPNCTTPASGTSMTAAEASLGAEVLVLANLERTGAGLGAMSWHGPLAQAAFEHSWDMSTRAFFSHTNPCGEEPWDRVDRAGISWNAIGENIARGQSTAAAVMAAWMGSQGHRDNILDSRFTRCSIGVYQVGGDTYWTMVLIREP